MEYKGRIMRQLIDQMGADLLSEKTIHAISTDTGLRQETVKKLLYGKGNLQSFGILLDYYAVKFHSCFYFEILKAKAMAKNLFDENQP